jgi:hypothetical protein
MDLLEGVGGGGEDFRSAILGAEEAGKEVLPGQHRATGRAPRETPRHSQRSRPFFVST